MKPIFVKIDEYKQLSELVNKINEEATEETFAPQSMELPEYKADDMDWTLTEEKEDLGGELSQEIPDMAVPEESPEELSDEDIPEIQEAPTKEISEGPIEELPELPVLQEESGEKYFLDGELYVRGENFRQLFDSVKDMKQGLEDVHQSVNEFVSTKTEEEHFMFTFSENLTNVQSKLQEIDSRLFEQR